MSPMKSLQFAIAPQASAPARRHLLTRVEMEQRRLDAATLLQAGVSQARTARQLSVSSATASRWARQLATAGREALRRRRAPGRPSRLSAQQLQTLWKLYRAQPDPAWTCTRMADLILQRFGVDYQTDHAGRILRRLRERAGRTAR
jgi:transposase